nr:MAG TPA: zinc finger protein [Caudoviricetes sp.]
MAYLHHGSTPSSRCNACERVFPTWEQVLVTELYPSTLRIKPVTVNPVSPR